MAEAAPTIFQQPLSDEEIVAIVANLKAMNTSAAFDVDGSLTPFHCWPGSGFPSHTTLRGEYFTDASGKWRVKQEIAPKKVKEELFTDFATFEKFVAECNKQGVRVIIMTKNYSHLVASFLDKTGISYPDSRTSAVDDQPAKAKTFRNRPHIDVLVGREQDKFTALERDAAAGWVMFDDSEAPELTRQARTATDAGKVRLAPTDILPPYSQRQEAQCLEQYKKDRNSFGLTPVRWRNFAKAIDDKRQEIGLPAPVTQEQVGAASAREADSATRTTPISRREGHSPSRQPPTAAPSSASSGHHPQPKGGTTRHVRFQDLLEDSDSSDPLRLTMPPPPSTLTPPLATSEVVPPQSFAAAVAAASSPPLPPSRRAATESAPPPPPLRPAPSRPTVAAPAALPPVPTSRRAATESAPPPPSRPAAAESAPPPPLRPAATLPSSAPADTSPAHPPKPDVEPAVAPAPPTPSQKPAAASPAKKAGKQKKLSKEELALLDLYKHFSSADSVVATTVQELHTQIDILDHGVFADLVTLAGQSEKIDEDDLVDKVKEKFGITDEAIATEPGAKKLENILTLALSIARYVEIVTARTMKVKPSKFFAAFANENSAVTKATLASRARNVDQARVVDEDRSAEDVSYLIGAESASESAAAAATPPNKRGFLGGLFKGRGKDANSSPASSKPATPSSVKASPAATAEALAPVDASVSVIDDGSPAAAPTAPAETVVAAATTPSPSRGSPKFATGLPITQAASSVVEALPKATAAASATASAATVKPSRSAARSVESPERTGGRRLTPAQDIGAPTATRRAFEGGLKPHEIEGAKRLASLQAAASATAPSRQAHTASNPRVAPPLHPSFGGAKLRAAVEGHKTAMPQLRTAATRGGSSPSSVPRSPEVSHRDDRKKTPMSLVASNDGLGGQETAM